MTCLHSTRVIVCMFVSVCVKDNCNHNWRLGFLHIRGMCFTVRISNVFKHSMPISVSVHYVHIPSVTMHMFTRYTFGCKGNTIVHVCQIFLVGSATCVLLTQLELQVGIGNIVIEHNN